MRAREGGARFFLGPIISFGKPGLIQAERIMPSKNVIRAFQDLLGRENVYTEAADRHAYSFDSAVLEPVVPELVVQPRDTESLAGAVRLCNENDLPLTVRGAGTNLSGGTLPSEEKGVVLLINALDRILEINTEDLYARVEPGVITSHFARAVAEKGLFYPPDPGSQNISTLGGNVAENAGGLRGLKYGVTKDYVLGVDFFDVNGELIKTGARTVKCATGLNLAQLMVGSEGTLGVFKEIVLKLVPPPAAQQAMLAVFDSVDRASETVSAIIADKILPCTLEFLDNFTIRAVESFRGAGLPTEAGALLLIEVDGHPAQVEEDARRIREICEETGQLHHPRGGILSRGRSSHRGGGAPAHRGGRPSGPGGGGRPPDPGNLRGKRSHRAQGLPVRRGKGIRVAGPQGRPSRTGQAQADDRA